MIDLDYRVRGLWDYQIETLKLWAGIVDGFRCDVASLVPVAFWEEARRACAEVNPDTIWLAESVHMSFQLAARRAGMEMIYSDAEGYAAFDLEYDYDIRELLDDYWADKRPLHEWVEALNRQEISFPMNYIKMRCLENHDQPRIASRVSDPVALSNWHALLFFQKGATLLYAGEEKCDANQPSLFDRDPVHWDGRDISDELRRLAALKKCFPADCWFGAVADDDQHAICAQLGGEGRRYLGLFSLKGAPVRMSIERFGGDLTCENLLDGTLVEIRGGMIQTDGRPVIVELPA